MTLAKEPAYKVKELAERIGNDAVFEAVFSDLFEGKLTGKTYMLDYDENIQDFGGNFINSNKEPPDPFEEYLAIENPTREDRLNYRKANEEYWANVINIVPVLRAWPLDLFRKAFKGFSGTKANLETPFSDIAKIPWEMVDQKFKNYLTGTITAKGVYMGGLYLSETGLKDWLKRHGQEWPLGLKPSARIPDPSKRGRNPPGALVSAAKAARNKIKNNPNSQQAGKTKISWIFRELQKSKPEVLEKKAGGIKSKQTIRRELGNNVVRPKWDKD